MNGSSNVRIVTDSTADLPPELTAELGITVVPLQVHFGSEAYRDGVDLTPSEFYTKLRAASDLPKTSQPSVGAFEEAYDRLCAETDSILSIHISSSLSGTYGSALLARDSVRNRCNVEVLDSRLASLGLGLVVLRCAQLARESMDLRDLTHYAKRMLPNVHIIFMVETLEYLQRGGRIGRAQAFLGSLLNIKPLLKVEEGEVRPVEKVRTRSKALDRLVEFVELFEDIEQLGLIYSTTPEDAEVILRRIEPLVPRERVIVSQVGPVVGTHTGPGILGLAVSQGVEEE
jgi:DegV family protein with EDD domain